MSPRNSQNRWKSGSSLLQPSTLLLCFASILALSARADSVVVFNELMYHPPEPEESREWIELHNQMAVDVDLSRWSIQGGVQFSFPEGTTISGGGYLVIAAAPEVVRAVTGLTNVFGPFTGRLANSGEELELRNNSGRLMDTLDYGVEDDWPVAPDGAGVSLVKRDENLSSVLPANWTSSPMAGGTPGARNFALKPFEVNSTSPVTLSHAWRYDLSGIAPPAGWQSAAFDDSGWAAGDSVFQAGDVQLPPGDFTPIDTLFNTGVGPDGKTLPPGSSDPHYWLVESAQSQPPPPDIRATVIQNHPVWAANDLAASWIGPVNPGEASVMQGTYRYKTDFDLTEYDPQSASIMVSVGVDNTLQKVFLNGALTGIEHSGFTSMSSSFALTDGFRSGVNTLEFVTFNESDSPNPAGLRVVMSSSARKQLTAKTRLTAPRTTYFRTSFVLNSYPSQTAALLTGLISDGAIFYLNGTEVLRLNLPAGVITADTPALTNASFPIQAGPISLPVRALLQGTNILAVEVHSGAVPTNRLLFGASLALQTTNILVPPPITLALNEVASGEDTNFFVEVHNYGANPVLLEGLAITPRGGATNREFAFEQGTLTAGQYLELPRAVLGFAADPGDRLFLQTADGARVLDAVVVKRSPRARIPDGQGRWMVPSTATPSAANVVQLQTDVVFNEIMYHAPPLPPQPAEYMTNALVAFSDVWKYSAAGVFPGSGWQQPAFDDSNWSVGAGGFYNSPAFLPIPKQTELPLATEDSRRIVTWYFRTVFTNQIAGSTGILQLRSCIDDGAVVYLNGAEIYRKNMPAGVSGYETLASAGVATAVLEGPFGITVTNLVPGLNVVAAEVHQFSTNPIAADMVFGLQVEAEGQFIPAEPRRESPEQWLELFNRGTNAIDLAGWRIRGDVDFDFSGPTVISSGGFLVLARDPEFMRENYPWLTIAGQYSGRLSRKEGLLVLRDPLGNPADEVHYYDGGAWPSVADGGGASLELRDPRADNSVGGAWGGSTPSPVGWSNYVYRAVANNTLGPTLWKEFVLGLLDAGECLVDDLRVVESPNTAPREMLQNGSFESGLNAWRALGTHNRSRVIADPDDPGNRVLHLVATGPTEHMHNHLETTLADGQTVVNGRTYEISFRAKWLSGNNLLNTRLYFNRVARTTALALPETFGTPGRPNSILAENIGPTITSLGHFPVVPGPNQPITVSAAIADPDGVGQVLVRWRIEGGQWQSAIMSPRSTSDANSPRMYDASIPGQSAGRLVQFYVQAADAKGSLSLFPPEGPDSRALFRIDRGEALMTQLHRLRMLMTQQDAALLHAPTNVMSNDRLKLTVIYNEREVFYNVGAHLQGSQRGRNDPGRVGFHLKFNRDHLFRGEQNNLVIDRSGGPAGIGGKHEEILLWNAINHAAGGLLGLDCDLVQVFAPRTSDNSTGLLRMSAFDADYFDNQFENGGDGGLYKLELVYYPLGTLNGQPESPKLPQPDEVINVDIQDRGSDPESYRWIFLQENNTDLDNYDQVIALNKAFSLAGTALQQRIGSYIDTDQWMRALAFKAFIGDPDTFTYGLNHNWVIYFRPEDGRALGLLWDMDLSFLQDVNYSFPGNGSASTARITALPDSTRRYYHHVSDLLTTTVNPSYLRPWANHYAGLLGQDWSGVINYFSQRGNYIRNRLPKPAPFAILSNGGRGFTVQTNHVVISGIAPLSVDEFKLNGAYTAVAWTSLSNWSMNVAFVGRINPITIQGFDSWGNPIPNVLGSILVTNAASPEIKPVVLNEWMADNAGPGGFVDSLDGSFSDWFELYNPNDTQVDLSGYYLTDSLSQPAKWQVPAGTHITPQGFLLVWADNEVGQNGAGTNGDLHVNFQLGRSGETLALFSPAGVLQHSVTFGAQQQNVSQGLFPDGQTGTAIFMDDWTPRRPNRAGAATAPAVTRQLVQPDGAISLEIAALPGRTYQVQYKDHLEDPNWLPLSKSMVADTETLVLSDGTQQGAQRFYRIVLIK